MQLYDEAGDLTAIGSAARIIALVVAIVSGVALVPATVFGLLSGMVCDGGCTSAVGVAVAVTALSPVLLLTSTVAGVVAFRAPSRGPILLALMPAAIAGLAFAIVFGPAWAFVSRFE